MQRNVNCMIKTTMANTVFSSLESFLGSGKPHIQYHLVLASLFASVSIKSFQGKSWPEVRNDLQDLTSYDRDRPRGSTLDVSYNSELFTTMVQPTSVFRLRVSRQLGLISWKFKLLTVILCGIIQIGIFLLFCKLPGTKSESPLTDWDWVPKRTAFLDRPCDKALREICQANGSWSCPGM